MSSLRRIPGYHFPVRKPGETKAQIDKQKYVTYVYQNREYKVSQTTLDSFDCAGELTEYVKDLAKADRCYGGNDYDDDEDDDGY